MSHILRDHQLFALLDTCTDNLEKTVVCTQPNCRDQTKFLQKNGSLSLQQHIFFDCKNSKKASYDFLREIKLLSSTIENLNPIEHGVQRVGQKVKVTWGGPYNTLDTSDSSDSHDDLIPGSAQGVLSSLPEGGLLASQSDHHSEGPSSGGDLTDQPSLGPSYTEYPTLTNSMQNDPDPTDFKDDPDLGFIPDEASWQRINKAIDDTPKPDTSSCLSPMANISLCKHGHFLCQSVHHSGTLTILLNKSQLVRRKQNEKIDKEEGLSGDNPDQHLRNMIDSALMPQRDPAFRCHT